MQAGAERGFTLIELMVTVAIIGVLAATAIPAFMKYVKKAKTSEARQNVRKIYDGARGYFLDPNYATVTGMQANKPMYPTTNLGGVQITSPMVNCCAAPLGGVPNEKCIPNAAEWEQPLWKLLHFGMTDPHYYAYDYYVLNGLAFNAVAYGNLDCDLDRSIFIMYGSTDSEGKPYGTGKMQRLDELE